jgi:hypothetical protein
MRPMPEDRNESGQAAPAEAAEPGETEPRSASRDLADGLELMLRAARKAVKNIDPGRIEALGRRAVQGIENLDRKKVGAFGRKAAKNLDPRRIEEIAEEAGRELLNVVERVAERVESAVGGAPRTDTSAKPRQDPASGSGSEEKPPEQRTRVRIDGE